MNVDVTVRDVMSHEFVGVNESDDVRGTVQLMLEEGVDCAVVLRGQEPVGVLTERDVLTLVAEDGSPEGTTVGELMGESGPTVAPEAGPFARFRDLAAHDSVAVKVSEIVHRSNEEFPYADMHGHVRWFLEEFGRERVVWGSDFPNVSDEASYAESLDWLEHVDGLSDADRRWIRGRAFERHVGLD